MSIPPRAKNIGHALGRDNAVCDKNAPCNGHYVLWISFPVIHIGLGVAWRLGTGAHFVLQSTLSST